MTPALRIAARRDGFRRAGIAHPAQAIEHPAGRFTPGQVEALLEEPMLVVEILPAGADAAPATIPPPADGGAADAPAPAAALAAKPAPEPAPKRKGRG